jgi:PAS domain S-box-containing protein
MSRQSWFINRRFLLNILLPVLLTLVLFVVALFQIVIPRFEGIVMERKREMIREMTHVVWHIADHYRSEVREGRLTEEQARQSAIDQVRNMRYGSDAKDYFWIIDFGPRMIMHPFREDLDGQDLSEFRDLNGKKLFVEIVRVVEEQEEGFVDYTWQWKDDSTRIVPKLSHVTPYRPWGWIIGTGIYIEDVKEEIADLQSNVVNISLWITASVSLLLVFIAVQNLRSERRRRKAEDELREAKERNEALVEASTEGLLMMLNGEEMYYNKTLLSMLGYTEEEARGVMLDELLPEGMAENLRAMHGPGRRHDDMPPHMETRLRRKDGSEIDVMLTVSSLQVIGKAGIVVIVKDISHHKLIADALDESKEKFSALTNRLSLAVFRTDAGRDMRFVETNLATARIFGFGSPEELQKEYLRHRFDDATTFGLLMEELTETGFVTNRIVRIRKRDGTLAQLSLSLALVRDAGGHARYCDGIAEDVSEDKRIEADTENLISEIQTPLLFLRQPVRSFVRRLHCIALHETIPNVARLMNSLKTDTVFVTGEEGRCIGMITAADIGKTLAAPGNTGQRAYEIMQAPIATVSDTATVYEVLAAHHETDAMLFGVKDAQGAISGILRVTDLQKSQLNTYLFFLKRLQHASSVAELRHIHERLLVYIRMLIESGAGVRNMMHAMTVVSDAIVQSLIRLAIGEYGPPPAKFVFLAMGSEGRSEQTLVTDQDNAILYEDVPEQESEHVHAWFLRFGTFISDALNEVGYAWCKGNVMAKNPKWCRPLRTWQHYFSGWVENADPKDLLDVSIFFDFRVVYGDEALGARLRSHLRDILSGNNAFFVYLAQNALRIKPPTWQFKAVEQVELKWAMLPLVDIARIHALKHRVSETNTMKRFARLHEKDVFSTVGYRDIVQAYAFLMELRYRHQAALLAENAPPNNTINTHELGEIQKATLRRVLSQIEDFQSRLSVDFKGMM